MSENVEVGTVLYVYWQSRVHKVRIEKVSKARWYIDPKAGLMKWVEPIAPGRRAGNSGWGPFALSKDDLYLYLIEQQAIQQRLVEEERQRIERAFA